MPTSEPSARAIALAYAGGDSVPQIVAKGQGLVAEEIVRRALAAGVTIHQSRELAALLMHVDLGEEIPPQLYRAVAELLVWIYRVEERIAPGKG
jgi:flagellar biosynthesis protein